MRLIDADALLKAIVDFPYGYRGMIKSVIDNQPTIDAEPVIRCKDCKHRPILTDRECDSGFKYEFQDERCPCQCDDPWYNWMPDDDWFCGNGERKEE